MEAIGWWTDGAAPSGYLRILFYSGLLFLCIVDHPTPLDAPAIHATVTPYFYTPGVFAKRLRLDRLRPQTLRTIRGLTVTMMALAAAGAFQPVPQLLVLIGFALLHSCNSGALAGNHSTHAALYSLFAMCFSVTGHSLDSVLIPGGLVPHTTLLGMLIRSRFGLNLALVLLVYILFSAGLSKLRYGWRGWLSGRALQFYLHESQRFTRAPRATRLILSRPPAVILLAWLGLATELGSICAIFLPDYRLWIVASWVGLHVSIFILMYPAHFIQCWCYLLIVWPAAQQWGWDDSRPTIAVPVSVMSLGAAIGYAMAALLILCILNSWEEWPLTTMPMYSNGTIAPLSALAADKTDLCSRASAAVRGRHSSWCRPWVDGEVTQEIWLISRNEEIAPSRLFDTLSGTACILTVRWSQYVSVVRDTTIRDLALRQRIDDAPRRSPASMLLAELAESLRNHGLAQTYKAVQLVCQLGDGPFVVASARIATVPGSTVANH